MKKILLMLTLAVVIASCGNNVKEEKANKQNNETTVDSQEPETVVKLDPDEKIFKKYANGQPLLVMRYQKTGKKHIPVYQKEFFENGQISKEGPMVNVRRNGLWKSFYKTGELWSETYYKDGYLDSITTAYYKNGKVRYKGQYYKSHKTGVWEFFNEQGELTDTKDYGSK